MIDNETMDITPSPRILRTLGEIPFSIWQCLAELIDNAIDAFMSNMERMSDDEKKVIISWSSESVSAGERTIEVSDNACGMSIEQLQNSVRAGYSSNDPIGHLGLFGMGFNISTARLGDVTTIMTTRKGDTEWVGVKIDFQKLISSKRFDAPVIKIPKENFDESGTKITISRLKTGISSELYSKENDIRQRLEAIYAPLLKEQQVNIVVKGKQLHLRNHCVWSATRYVRYQDQNVPARIEIDRNLGDALFDLRRNSYLTPDEAEPYYAKMQDGEPLPEHIVERGKRLTGWLGIQRYADPNDFGIDFIRNGRKILISDKSLFQYENPLTGQKELQYPLELGTSIGGRIVGELKVDYLLPTYQKNDFDRTDSSWAQTVEALCGVGPFLPKSRKAMGFVEPNTSPLCLLVNAYRRVDKGTKCLFAPNDVAKRFYAEFRKGTRDYLDDVLWWRAAQEEDQKQSTGDDGTTAVNTGYEPSDDISSYLGTGANPGEVHFSGVPTGTSTIQTAAIQTGVSTPVLETSKLDELIQRSTIVNQLTGRHYRFGNVGSLNVRVYELNSGSIKYKGERRPCFFSSEGIDCDFVYDPSHELLSQYPFTPKMLLLIYLAEKLKARDSLPDILSVFSELATTTMQDSKIDRQSLQDKASSAFEHLREKMAEALSSRAGEVVKCIHEASGEVEETVANIIQADISLLQPFQSGDPAGYDAIQYVPAKTLYRLIERFPEEIFDGKVLQTPYSTIKLQDEKATQRAKEEAKDRTLSFIKDAMRVISGVSLKNQKNELTRASLSVEFLIRELNG